MLKRLIAIGFIYFCTVIAWMILGSTVLVRTNTFDSSLRGAVSQIWGTVQTQTAPTQSYQTPREELVDREENGRKIKERKTVWDTHFLPLEGSDIKVDLDLEHRQKGLLWYSTYKVGYDAIYTLANDTGETRDMNFTYKFPEGSAVYDNFKLAVNGVEAKNVDVNNGTVNRRIGIPSGGKAKVAVHYVTQGLDQWWYDFGNTVTQVKNFKLVMHTDFARIDFPPSSISATEKTKAKDGWNLTWQFKNMLTAVKIGMDLPKKLNPGPWVSEVTFSAPISLFLFFFLIFVISALRNIKLHPMHYFFLASAFFSFHLLLAYLVDHLSIEASVVIASIVSVALATSYMRLVVSARFAFVEVALAQFVYLVLFSCTFFLEGYTGLAITILCISTLFVVMQVTGRLNWEAIFRGEDPASSGQAKS